MKTSHKIIFFLLFLCCFQQWAIAQDTITVVKTEKRIRHVFKAEPVRATMLATAFPGLGQIYNRKYWKVPLVYAGFGGLAYSINFNSGLYNKYLKAYQDFTDAVAETDSYLDMLPGDPSTYDPVLYPKTAIASNTAHWKERMMTGIDYYKKYRDLSYIGVAVWYLATVLDANVDASLFNYDISDNLDLAIAPAQLLPTGETGMGLMLSMRVNF